MKVSVIVTAYNRAQALKKSLWSLNAQTRLPDEVIVSDDGSSEDILASLEQYSALLSFSLTFVRQDDKGFRLARCRNNAVRAATGDYLVFMDQDIVVTAGYINLYADHAGCGEFLVAYPVLLTEEQSAWLTLDLIEKGDYRAIITNDQLVGIRRQFRKDSVYRLMRKVFRRGNRPKVRGGAFGIFRRDLLAVDGFDDNYVGWGTEDDDLGRRLYRAGVTGRTGFLHDFPLHLWHPHSTGAVDSVNLPYYKRRLREIARGDYRAVNGISNPLGDDVPTIVGVR
jgi:glycosyltransferase involved in cell wall biosynthesis